MIKNKKAEETGDQIMVFAFMFLLVIIGVGIWLGVSIYFGSSYDSRQVDANLLLYKVENCFTNSNIIEFQGDFYAICGINQGVVENNQLMIKVCSGNDVNSCINNASSFLFFGKNLAVDCALTGGNSNNAYPKCSNDEITKDGKSYIIITGSNQQIRRFNT